MRTFADRVHVVAASLRHTTWGAASLHSANALETDIPIVRGWIHRKPAGVRRHSGRIEVRANNAGVRGRSKVFGEMIDHHATEEEKTMFKQARKVFSSDELAQLDDDYAAWKTSATGKKAVSAAMQEFRAG